MWIDLRLQHLQLDGLIGCIQTILPDDIMIDRMHHVIDSRNQRANLILSGIYDIIFHICVQLPQINCARIGRKFFQRLRYAQCADTQK